MVTIEALWQETYLAFESYDHVHQKMTLMPFFVNKPST